MAFSERLKICMMVAGRSNKKMAELTRLSESNISHFVTGGREPTVENLAKLLKAMPGIDARWLVIGEEAKP